MDKYAIREELRVTVSDAVKGEEYCCPQCGGEVLVSNEFETICNGKVTGKYFRHKPRQKYDEESGKPIAKCSYYKDGPKIDPAVAAAVLIGICVFTFIALLIGAIAELFE